MKSDLAIALKAASKTLGQCAKLIDGGRSPINRTLSEYERIIGIGMARDWVEWGRCLKDITYTNKRLSGSGRAGSLNGITRFTYLWTATNALFARSAVLTLLDATAGSKTSELERFRILFNNSNISSANILAFESTLHGLLAVPIEVKHFPWVSANTSPTILEIIYYKYTVSTEQSRPFGKMLLQAATTGNYSMLDLPSLIYATRNWNIHGVLLSSSFRGTQNKFNLWIETVNMALAKVLQGSSVSLLAAI